MSSSPYAPSHASVAHGSTQEAGAWLYCDLCKVWVKPLLHIDGLIVNGQILVWESCPRCHQPLGSREDSLQCI